MSDMSDAQHDAEAHTKTLVDDIKALREDLARMANIVEELVRRRANDAAEEVTRQAERAWDDAGKFADDASRAVEANPLGAVGGAFGLGLLLGLLFGRR